MQSFWRAMGFAWPYRSLFVTSILSGFVVAAFYGANISAICPVLTVLLDKQSLVEWTEQQIDREQKEVAHHESHLQNDERDLATLRAESARTPNDTSVMRALARKERDLAERQRKLSQSMEWLAWYRRMLPVAIKYTPNGTEDAPFRTLCYLMGLVLIAILIKGAFDFLQEYLAGQVVNLAIYDLRNEMYRRTMRLDLSFFDERGTHDFMARFTNDIESLASGMRALLGKVLLEPLKAITCLVCALWFNWRLTLLALLLFPIAAVAMGMIGKYLKRVNRKNLESMTRMYKILQESFVGFRVVKAFSMEQHERKRFFRENRQYLVQSRKLARTDAFGGPVIEFLSIGGLLGSLLIGAYLVMTQRKEIFGITLTNDPISSSVLLTFYALIAGVGDSMRKVFGVYGRVQRGIAAAERVFHTMDHVPKVKQKPHAPMIKRHHQSLEYSGITFGYGERDPVLHNVSFEVAFGETIAIVGFTGCGKTSLINLLPRLYDPISGKILLDGVDIRDISLRSLRDNLGIVTQNTILFDDTVYNNIAYGSRDVTAEQIEHAAKAAYAHNFIVDMPHGYNTMIGEMGGQLSGGQRQRIALARAILRDPSILILDEATSSLDVESEALIHQALKSFKRGRTTFIVTHRMSTLEIADRIVVVNKGRIEAIGTKDEILATSETFRRLTDVSTAAPRRKAG